MTESIAAVNESKYTSVDMTRKHWILMGLCLFPAALLAFGGTIHNETWQLIYTPLFHLMILLIACICVGRRRANAQALFLFACDTALIGLGFIRHNLFLCCMNCLIIPVLTASAMMNVSGAARRNPLSAAGMAETIIRSIGGLFSFVPLPFVKLFGRSKASPENAILCIISFGICLPVMLLVLLLLSSADNVFNLQVQNIISSAENLLSSPSAFRIPLTLISALMIFSWMFALTAPARKMNIAEIPVIPSVFASMLLPMLNAAYSMFVCIQFRNLFGGAESAAMTGGYAEYARSGFFQLVAVAMINLCILAAASKSRRNGWISIMSALMIALTGVILFSALWRMKLYIIEYGLTVLRVMTLWGMLAIAVLLVVFVLSLFRKNFPLLAVAVICVIVLWVGLNIIDIDRIIAEYNVYHYLSGELAELDREYISTLSPSARAILDQINP